MATSTFTFLQRGAYNIDTGSWVENGGLYNFTETQAWVVYDLTSLSGSLSTDATNATLDYQTNGIGTINIDLLVLNRPVLAALSASNPPTGAYNKVGWQTFVTVAEPSIQQINIPLRESTGAATPFLSALMRANEALAGDGLRRFAVGIQITRGVGGVGAVTARFDLEGTLTLTTESPAFTGLEGPYQAQGRADECPKCGLKSTRDTWVRDGYTKLMVCGECYDEEDRVGRHYQGLGSERPGQGEG